MRRRKSGINGGERPILGHQTAASEMVGRLVWVYSVEKLENAPATISCQV
jgi:hypothetical protein